MKMLIELLYSSEDESEEANLENEESEEGIE
jgi:hypothetical protein